MCQRLRRPCVEIRADRGTRRGESGFHACVNRVFSNGFRHLPRWQGWGVRRRGDGGGGAGASAPAPELVQGGDGAAEVRDHDGAAHPEAVGERLEELLVREAQLGAADEVVRDAVVAAEDEGCDEAEELLGPGVEGPVLVDAGVEGPEAADLEVALLEDALVELLAEAVELFETHGAVVLRSAMASSSGGPSLSR